MAAEQYFQSIAEEIFSDILGQLGARRTRLLPLVVRFESGEWFVELLALAEDGPRYSPRVEIGPLPERGTLPRDKQVDILHTVPGNSPLRRYNLEWCYSDPIEMRHAYKRVRDEVFKPFALAVLLDRKRLNGLVASRSQEVQRQWEEEVAAHNDAVYRKKAQAVIAKKDFKSFLEQMRKIPEERQTKAERARVRFVEKQLRK